MENIRISLETDEKEFVEAHGKGWLRNVVRRFMEVEEQALTPEELIYLRDHGGTKGVIAIARGEKNEADFDAVTGIWSPKAHGGEMQPHDDEDCHICGRPLYDGVCRNTNCSRCPSGETTEQTWDTPSGRKVREGYAPAKAISPEEHRREKP